jgi:hypothetical protein
MLSPLGISPNQLFDWAGTGEKGQTVFAGNSVGHTVADGFAPMGSFPNHVKFAARAGDCMIFDLATFHTAQPNVSDDLCAQCPITSVVYTLSCVSLRLRANLMILLITGQHQGAVEYHPGIPFSLNRRVGRHPNRRRNERRHAGEAGCSGKIDPFEAAGAAHACRGGGGMAKVQRPRAVAWDS